MRYVALMPLRGGSKSIPKKNIMLLHGKPLFQWALEAAIQSDCFEQICVSTDCEEIKAVVQRQCPSVKVLDRAKELATDEASSEAVIMDFIEKIDGDVLCLIQATSPLTGRDDFIAARKLFETKNLDSLLTAVPMRRFLWNREAKPLNYDPAHRPRRQDMVPSLIENGAFYFTKYKILRQLGNRLGGKIGIHEMAPDSTVEIDEPEDWRKVEELLKTR